jgi:hypothetical protein
MSEINARGATVERAFAEGDRYYFDFTHCTAAKGWQQYDTEQDASYFGVWIHAADRVILTYAEGDITIVTCPTEDIYQAELRHMADFYGSPPAIATAILPDGQIAKVYNEAGAFGRPLPTETT